MSVPAHASDIAFTCLVPVWGGDDPGAFAAAMQSLAASTLAPDAIVIAQDGALPEPLGREVSRAAEALNARRVVNAGPPGLQHNLNRAVEAVETSYVARFDADDLNLPDRFAAQVAFARSHPEVAVFGGAILEFAPGGATRRKAAPVTHEAILRFAAWRNPINHMTAFFRRDAFLAAGGYPDLPRKEDYGLWLAMLARGERLANLPQILVHARLGKDFSRRRAGLGNLASERGLHRLKRAVPGLDHRASAVALAVRSAALAFPGPARLAYWGLRRVKTVKAQGGIGNQLFCLAFAHSVARLSEEPVAIDVAAFASDRYGHAFVLEDLALKIGDVRLVRRPIMAARLTTAAMRAAPLPGYASEGAPPTGETGLAKLIARGRYFNGYWQNEAYIARPEEFAALAREAVFRRAGRIRGGDVAIHYRTYREEIRGHARRTAGADYVRAALAHIEAALGRPAELSLVSDDAALALRSLGGLGREITVAAGEGPWGDMARLMTARALILTNSSFSWWGGYCGAAEAAVYPRPDGYFHYPIPAARFTVI